MLRFSANIGFLWPDRPLLERIDAAARAGFRAVELHWPYATPADAVRARCERNGVTLLNINSPRGDVDSGKFGLAAIPGREAAFLASMDDAIAYAANAGARAIHVIAGIVPPGGEERAADVLAANLSVAADMAAAHGLTLYLEPMARTVRPGYFYSTADAAAEMIRRVGKANIRLMFDFFHLSFAAPDAIVAFEEHLPLIGHVQIAGAPDRHEPDRGSRDYRAVLAAIIASGYDGWVGAEYNPRGDTDAGLGWLAALGQRL